MGTLVVEPVEPAAGDGAVVVLTISNPAKRNALDVAVCDGLVAALAALPARGARAAVLRGDPAGRAFSAGFDLDAIAGTDPARRRAGVHARARGDGGVPGAAGRGGDGGRPSAAAARWRRACDLRVAHAGAKLGLPPAKLGIVYPARGLARFSALCGESRARQLFLLARVVTGAEALGWGLVDEVVEPAAVEARAGALAAELAALVPEAVQGMRLTFEALLARRAALEGPQAEEIARRRAEAWRSLAPKAS